MKRVIAYTLIVIFSYILQSTLCQYMAFGHICPNLLLAVVATFGFTSGKKAGLLTGFFAGLFLDIFDGGVLGYHALLLMYIGYCNGFFKRLFYKDELKLQFLLIGVSDFVYNLIYYVAQFLLRSRFHFKYYFLHIILPELVYTLLITIVIFIITNTYFRWKKRFDHRSEELA